MASIHQTLLPPLAGTLLLAVLSCADDPSDRSERRSGARSTESGSADASREGGTYTISFGVRGDAGGTGERSAGLSLGAITITDFRARIACTVPEPFEGPEFNKSPFKFDPGERSGCRARLLGFKVSGSAQEFVPKVGSTFTTYDLGDESIFVTDTQEFFAKVDQQISLPDRTESRYRVSELLAGASSVDTRAAVPALASAVVGDAAPKLRFRPSRIVLGSAGEVTLVVPLECTTRISGTALGSASCGGDSLANLRFGLTPTPTTIRPEVLAEITTSAERSAVLNNGLTQPAGARLFAPSFVPSGSVLPQGGIEVAIPIGMTAAVIRSRDYLNRPGILMAIGESSKKSFTYAIVGVGFQNLIQKCDVNNDGSITTDDAALIQSWIASHPAGATLPPVKAKDEGFVDVNGDGRASTEDLTPIQSYLGSPTSSTACN